MAIKGHARNTKALASKKIEAHIQRAIFEGKLKPRERVIEEDIAHALRCSRGPVREALLRLERDGIVVITPRRGTFVRDFSPEDIETLFGIRGKLEALAVRYMRENAGTHFAGVLNNCLLKMKTAAESGDDDGFFHADMDLHQNIWKLSGRTQLYTTLRFTINPLFFLIARQYTRMSGSLAEAFQNHENYVQMVLTTPVANVEAEVENYFRELFRTLDERVFHRRREPAASHGAAGAALALQE